MNEFANIERLELFDLQLFAYEKLLYLKDQIETKMKILEKLEQVENVRINNNMILNLKE